MGTRLGRRPKSKGEGETRMKTLIELLQANKEASGFRICTQRTESYELFFVHRSLETVRATDTTQTSVTVYVNHDGKVGDSSFTLYGSMNDEEIKGKITTAVSRAHLVFNEPYELPEGGCEKAELPSNLKGREPRTLAAEIADAVFAAADCVEGGSLNATEIFLYRDTKHVINSRGIDKEQVSYRIMIETIPTFTDADDSVELYESIRTTDFDAEKITKEIAEKMKEVALRHRAVKPVAPLKTDVILRAKEIAELMWNLADDLTYAQVYAQGNLHHEGDFIQNPQDHDASCDRVQLTATGILRGSDRSALFDQDGVALKDTTLIRDGRVSAYFGSHRFASYLGRPETGELPCIRLGLGTLGKGELQCMSYLECVSLSGLQVDLYNDYIGGEIRLAYLHEGDRVEPLTGITMSAKLSEVLATLRLSDTNTVTGSYEGPDQILLRSVTLM